MKRRQFVQKSLLASGGLLLPWTGKSVQNPEDKIRIGIVADIHQDIIHDAEGRLQVFINQMHNELPDFLIQLGDFCNPIKENKRFLKIWNQFEGSKHHVLGNHDMDVSSKSETMKFWGMKDNYYSFDHGGFHFIILDANFIKKEGQSNFIDYANANFYLSYEERPWIDDVQLKWFEKDLATTQLPTIVFSHQSLENEKWGVVNRDDVQSIAKSAKTPSGTNKVLACINGHHHADYHIEKEGINYVMINSMSYYWIGDTYKAKRYDDEIEAKYPHLQKIIPYKNPLFTTLTIEPNEYLHFSGMKTTFVPPGPEDLNFPDQPGWNKPTPIISDLTFKI